ncbi:MAG: phenylacetate--CoA ligase [Opitutaceae bacterium]|nr:phenylacetate--CoA ligase [Opitutaceae bacterium]
MSTLFEQDRLDKLNQLVGAIAETNAFYRKKLEEADALDGFRSLEHFQSKMPFTTKLELVEDQVDNPPYGSFFTYPINKYTRYHQTSGTSGRPLIWLDDQGGWQWVLENWKETWYAAGAKAGESGLFAFSFGPFIGFWAAFDSATQLGMRSIPAGGMGSADRLRFIMTQQPTYLCCTPTYALRLIDVAKDLGIDLTRSGVKCVIVGGEPGGSVPEIRERIETAWNPATVLDHHGMTEVGPVSYGDPDRPGTIRLVHDTYLCEVLDTETDQPVALGEEGELILTTLGRYCSPLIRYRTRDLVKPVAIPGEPPAQFALEGGILGRVDDMVIVRGVNLYPSALEAIVRSVPEIGEFQIDIDQTAPLTQVATRIETEGDSEKVAELLRIRLRDSLQMRIDVEVVESGSLPVFEMKARRWNIIK